MQCQKNKKMLNIKSRKRWSNWLTRTGPDDPTCWWGPPHKRIDPAKPVFDFDHYLGIWQGSRRGRRIKPRTQPAKSASESFTTTRGDRLKWPKSPPLHSFDKKYPPPASANLLYHWKSPPMIYLIQHTDLTDRWPWNWQVVLSSDHVIRWVLNIKTRITIHNQP